jgi:hypothetical protein
MQPGTLDAAEREVRLLLDAIQYVRHRHGLYPDGDAVLHFLPGHGCASVRELSMRVTYAMSALRHDPARPLPRAPHLPLAAKKRPR